MVVTMAILVIEDERKLAALLKKALASEHYTVDTGFDGEEGVAKAFKGRYSLILLDVMLPKKSGMEVCLELRNQHVHTPIIMLTARDTIDDRIAGLDIGADDYITKPFGMEELFARIRAVLRRRKTTESIVLRIADLTLDTKKHEVARGGKLILLTPKEYRLLGSLLRHNGEAMTRRQLIDVAWS